MIKRSNSTLIPKSNSVTVYSTAHCGCIIGFIKLLHQSYDAIYPPATKRTATAAPKNKNSLPVIIAKNFNKLGR